ncbi:MAG: hypothetical protein FH748_06110 [Balneolaceae bacterium]|nr:hypothetical protein [Balneolaceae bacterium]
MQEFIFLLSLTIITNTGILLSQNVKSSDPHYVSPYPLPEPVIFAPGIISTGDDESHPTFTPDGKTLYFLKNTPTFNHWTIVVSSFENDGWSQPEVASFSGQYSDADLAFSRDGRTMFLFLPALQKKGNYPKRVPIYG